MNKLADVIFAYVPKNDDELELKVGDRIEIIGLEEEGWWRGKLKGKIGVFPTNFVQVIESASATISTANNNNNNNNNNISSTTNKLSSLFGTNKSSKNSLSSNSLNSNSSNNNLTMNTTQQADNNSLSQQTGDDQITSEIKPKLIRGVGFGDIFALNGGISNISASLANKQAAKPLPADSIANSTLVAAATERLNLAGSTNNTLQKQVPKKPPPPRPVSDPDQAPALPPKPGNQFSPLLQKQQHHQPPRPLAQHQARLGGIAQRNREQAKVIFAYEPLNDDELALEVGDIIDIIDKEFEDAGWWKGELRGKIGVFPDNFVELIEKNIDQPQVSANLATSSHQTTPNLTNTHQINDTNNKPITKPVFAATPKDFSKELENNLQHNINSNHSNLSHLSGKRNKLQQMASMDPTYENGRDGPPTLEHSASLTSPSSIGKLNHITANRAKGPSRRPPSNILNKRNQSVDLFLNKEPPSNGKDDPSLASMKLNSNNAPKLLPSKPSEDFSTDRNPPATSHESLQPITTTSTHQQSFPNHTYLQNCSRSKATSIENLNKPNLPVSHPAALDTGIITDSNQTIAPKTSQRVNQQSSITNSTSTSTPSWMLELKKAQAEKKRDTPAVAPATPTTTTTTPVSIPATTPVSIATPVAPTTIPNTTTTNSNSESATINNQIEELTNEVKQLKLELASLTNLKSDVEVMKTELNACQKAIDNQKKYIKDLVNNLADERKKLASMQEELDRTLK